MKNILPDGSIEGQTFSGEKYKGEHPAPKSGETYAQYRARVKACVAQGFHLGDLDSNAWSCYCMGSGQYEGIDSDTRIK